ncbi:hypothetical protein [Lapidilactobacillus wuchangensis]|uniref:hypothetical protein n=1 Tax=Lapidilactobacillus wuchangensis TaxID=2486001 RepID=UPI0013DE06FE|nr:hypothetical protein [Lapidilactobacillus wuchangensis]
MEGVVVSRQICLAASAVRQRLALMTIWSSIGINRCRPRSTTSKPAMESDSILFFNFFIFSKSSSKKPTQQCARFLKALLS